MYALYVTHPQVVQDPTVPVPQWGLSVVGRTRAERFANHKLLAPVRRFVSSRETKALELAAILAVARNAVVEAGENFGENDRSSTGFVRPSRFEELVTAFFGYPDESVDGWEPARHAQQRIAAAFDEALATHDFAQPIVFTGHGAVGTLLKCHLGELAIARSEDQREKADPGGGNVFVVRLADRKLLTDWLAMEALPETFSF